MATVATPTTTSAITHQKAGQAYKTAAGKFCVLIVGSAGAVEIACDSKEELVNLLRGLELNAVSL